jgi:hypothetical protein
MIFTLKLLSGENDSLSSSHASKNGVALVDSGNGW